MHATIPDVRGVPFPTAKLVHVESRNPCVQRGRSDTSNLRAIEMCVRLCGQTRTAQEVSQDVKVRGDSGKWHSCFT